MPDYEPTFRHATFEDVLNAAFEWYSKSEQEHHDAYDANAIVEKLADPEWTPFRGLIKALDESIDGR